jgi:hypothetical protein
MGVKSTVIAECVYKTSFYLKFCTVRVVNQVFVRRRLEAREF